MEGLTTEQTVAVSAVAGSILAVSIVFVIIFYILTVIACWKIFTKAGEAGWKALIPVYNAYILYKISNVSFVFWLLIPAICMGVVSAIAGNVSNDGLKTILNLVYYAIEIVIYAKISSALAKAFGKGTGF